MNNVTETPKIARRGGHSRKLHLDTYKQPDRLREPTRCPQCAAVYVDGRWTWASVRIDDADDRLCSACHRLNDNYPAGELTLLGRFTLDHVDECIALAREIEVSETALNPMHRIIAVRTLPTEVQITTTDVHLPRRIGRALRDAWAGELRIHYDRNGYFASVVWRRDA